MAKKFNIDTHTTIYLTVIGVLLILQALMGGLTTSYIAVVLFLTTLPYLFITKRFYLVVPIISVLALLMTIATLPTAVYAVIGEEPSFVISSATLTFLIPLFLSNLVSHAEWSIRSPWVAALIGLGVLYFTEFSLLTGTSLDSQVLIGGLGALAGIVVSSLYLMVGGKVSVHKPTSLQSNSVVQQLSKELGSSGYLHVDSKAVSETQLLLLDTKSKTRDSFRVYPVGDEIFVDKDLLEKNKVSMFIKGKQRKLYAWLYREAGVSAERRRTKDIKGESFILMGVSDRTTIPNYEIIELSKARSKKKYYVGIINLSPTNMNKNKRLFKEMTVEIELLKNES